MNNKEEKRMLRVAINGFGRIGRMALRLLQDDKDVEVVAINNTTKDIATKLLISEKTVRNHISNVIQKLGVIGRSQAILELLRLNEIKL